MAEERSPLHLSFGKPKPRDSRFDTIAAAAVELETRVNFISEINRLWEESQERFLTIGRHLIRAKEKLQHGEFIAMIDCDLPFGRNAAHKMMTVAKAIDAEMVPAKLLPPDYTSAYLVVTLTDDERRQAINEGVLQPTTSRKTLVEFRRKVRSSNNRQGTTADRRAALEQEKHRLLIRLVEIRRELRNK